MAVISPVGFIMMMNLVLVSLAYVVIYPRYCGRDLNRMALYDVVLSSVSLLIAGVLFAGQGLVFNLVLFETNWFWFTLITFAAIEIPFAIKGFSSAA